MRGELWPIVTERIWLLNDDVGVVPWQLDRRFLAFDFLVGHGDLGVRINLA
jgi:hypothetical protein